MTHSKPADCFNGKHDCYIKVYPTSVHDQQILEEPA